MFTLFTSAWLLIPAWGVETACDGLDDDGDGLVDEDYDIDGDGVARCCDPQDQFFVARSGSSLENLEIFLWNGAGFDRGLTPIATHPQGTPIGQVAPADFDGNGTLDLLWREGPSETAGNQDMACP